MIRLALAFVGLLALLGVSVWAGYWPLGKWGWVVGLTIASLKAVVVLYAFMGFGRQVWEAKAAAWMGGAWLAFLFGLIFVDYFSR